jgi:hypothetical protein
MAIVTIFGGTFGDDEGFRNVARKLRARSSAAKSSLGEPAL